VKVGGADAAVAGDGAAGREAAGPGAAVDAGQIRRGQIRADGQIGRQIGTAVADNLATITSAKDQAPHSQDA